MNPIDSGMIGSVVGTLVSLVMLLFPKLNVWYASKTADSKKAFMLWVGIGVTVAAGLVSCFNLYAVTTCNTDGFISLLAAFVGYAVGNQSVYRIIPEPQTVKAAKLARQ